MILPCLVSGPSFMSISRLVLELWQFSFIRDWSEIWKSQIPLSEFFPRYGDLGNLGILNLECLSPVKSYWMLQNARVAAFIISELLRENQKCVKLCPPPPKIRIKNGCIFVLKRKHFSLFITCMVDKSYFLSHIYVIY